MSEIELPTNWSESRIGDVVEDFIEQGLLEDKRKFTYIDISAVDNCRKEITEPKFLSTADAPSRARQRVKPGDVLVSTTRPNLNAVALVPPDLVDAIASTGFAVLRPVLIEPHWLYCVVQSGKFVKAMSALVKGALYPAIRPSHVHDYVMPIPPLPEQRRIVSKVIKLINRAKNIGGMLGTLPTLIQQYRASVLEAACIGRLVPTEAEIARREKRGFEPASVLLERILVERRTKWETDQLDKMRMAGKEPENDAWRKQYPEPQEVQANEIFGLPEGWSLATAEQLTDASKTISYGIIKLGADVANGIPVLRSSNVRSLKLDLDVVKRVSPAIAEAYERTLLEGNEILITIRGTMGGVCALDHQLSEYNVSREIAVLSLVKPEFGKTLAAFIASKPLSNWLAQRVTGVAQQGINLVDLRRLPIPVPPVREMIRIADEVDRRLSAIDFIEEQVQGAQTQVSQLQASILNRALSGKLVQLNHSDEPVFTRENSILFLKQS